MFLNDSQRNQLSAQQIIIIIIIIIAIIVIPLTRLISTCSQQQTNVFTIQDF